MSEPTILDFYFDLLDSAGLQVDDDFFVVHKPESDKKKPDNVMVMNRKLVLPFPGHLKNPDPDNNVFFHPLCEQIIRGESEVFAFYKRAMTMRLILSISTLGSGLIRLHTDINLQKSMSIQQIEFIKDLVDAEDKTIATWTSFIWGHIKAHPHDSTHWPLRLYVKQNGRHGGKSYQRVCSVAFPLFERLFEGEEPCKPGTDQKYRAKDYKAFKQLAKAIFPEVDADVSEAYNSGYGDTFAPNLLSFLMSVKKIGDRINLIAETLKEPLERAGISTDTILVKTPWETFLTEDGVAKLAVFNRRIPALPGNMGVSGNQVEPTAEENSPPVRNTQRPTQTSDNDAKARLRQRWEAEKDDTVDPPWEDRRQSSESNEPKPTGQKTIGDILRKRPDLERSTLTYEEENRRYEPRGRQYDDSRGRTSRYGSRYDEEDRRRGWREEPVSRGRGWREDPEPRGYGRDYGRDNGRYSAPSRGLYDDEPLARRGANWRR